MRAYTAVAAAVVLTVLTVPAHAAEQPSAGQIKVVTGSAFIVRGNTVLPATVGQRVFEADRVRTGSDGRLGITLKDDTASRSDRTARCTSTGLRTHRRRDASPWR